MASSKIVRDAYDGTLVITHDPNAKGSQPRYVVTNKADGEETRPSGVTTILGEVLAKDFVSWALDMFEDAILQRLNSFLDDEYLTEADVAYAKLASSRKRDDGARAGSAVHAMIENYLKSDGQPEIDWGLVTKEIAKAYGAFVTWFEEVKPEVLGIEQVIYSRMYRYAGCYDALLKIDGKVYLADWKTTNASRTAPRGIYPEMFIQLGGYAGAMIEEAMAVSGIDKIPKIDGLMVVSLKKDGKLDIAIREDVDWCAQIFRDVMSIREFKKEAKEDL